MLSGEDGHVLRRELWSEVEGQRRKGKLKKILKRQLEKGSYTSLIKVVFLH